MKEGIHPNYNVLEVVCACGNRFNTRSTSTRIHLEVCNACHPFYTGRQKLLDTAGRVERFQKRYAQTEGKTVVRKPAAKVVPKPVKKVKGLLTNAPVKPKAAADKKAAPKAAKPAADKAAKAPAK